jgi:anti-anti-sigma regulatory factor
MQPQHDVAEESVIRVEGTLDGFAARRVEVALNRADPGARLWIDLTQVREFHDFGIAVLGQALARCAATFRLRGLRREHVCVLRAFGIDTVRFERALLTDAA